MRASTATTVSKARHCVPHMPSVRCLMRDERLEISFAALAIDVKNGTSKPRALPGR
jgi:hypothetical protein